jgi:hypothetical protein
MKPIFFALVFALLGILATNADENEVESVIAKRQDVELLPPNSNAPLHETSRCLFVTVFVLGMWELPILSLEQTVVFALLFR